jgi:hypothetical protein
LDRQSLSGIQAPELNTGVIRVLGNLSAQGIDFFDEMPFRKAPDGRIATHGGDMVHVNREEEGWVSHASGGKGSFAAGVTGTHHDYIIDLAVHGHEAGFLKDQPGMKKDDPSLSVKEGTHYYLEKGSLISMV